MADACGTAVVHRGEHLVRVGGAHSASTISPLEIAPMAHSGAQRLAEASVTVCHQE